MSMYIVVTTPGGTIARQADGGKPFDTESQAQQACDQANKQAQELGIKTRYEVSAVTA